VDEFAFTTVCRTSGSRPARDPVVFRQQHGGGEVARLSLRWGRRAATPRLRSSFLCLPPLTRSGGQASAADACVPAAKSSVFNPPFSGVIRPPAPCLRVASSEAASFASAFRQLARGRWRQCLPSPRGLAQVLHPVLFRNDVRLIQRLSVDRVRVERRPQNWAACANQFQLRRGSVRNETVERITRSTSGISRASPRSPCVRFRVPSSRSRIALPGVGSLRISRKVAIDSAFGLRVHRLKSNFMKSSSGHPGNRHQYVPTNDGMRCFSRKLIERGEKPRSRPLLSPGGLSSSPSPASTVMLRWNAISCRRRHLAILRCPCSRWP